MTVISNLLTAIGLSLLVLDVNAQKIKLDKTKYKYGADITVTVKKNAEFRPFVSILKNDVTDFSYTDADEMWLPACTGVSQDDFPWLGCFEILDGVKLVFGVNDPDSGNMQQWPLKSGKYKACLMDALESEDQVYTFLSCEDFKVKKMKKKSIKKMKIVPKKSSFPSGAAIKVDFEKVALVPNTWIGMYKNPLPEGSNKIEEPLWWVYTGCNNYEGDQEESNDCAEVKKEGRVTFNKNHGGNGEWPLEAGEYYFCISYDYNRPYKNFKCMASVEITDN